MDVARRGRLLDVPGVRDGHATDEVARTGCSVVVLPPGSVGGLDLRGGAPATRELGLLDPCAMQPHVDAFVLTGGSAPGLRCAEGVVEVLQEAGRGFATHCGPIPLVPGAALFDLGTGEARSPSARDGREACDAALAAGPDVPAVRGQHGAGTGARCGKVRGLEHAADGGLGQAALAWPDGLVVAALVAVNPYGDVRDPYTGAILAGARDDRGRAAGLQRLLARWRRASPAGSAPIPCSPSSPRTQRSTSPAPRGSPVWRKPDWLARCPRARRRWTATSCSLAATGEIPTSADRVGTIAAEVVAAAVLDAVLPPLGTVPA